MRPFKFPLIPTVVALLGLVLLRGKNFHNAQIQLAAKGCF